MSRPRADDGMFALCAAGAVGILSVVWAVGYVAGFAPATPADRQFLEWLRAQDYNGEVHLQAVLRVCDQQMFITRGCAQKAMDVSRHALEVAPAK